MHHHHSLSLPNWPTRVWTSVISLLGATLLVCLPASAIPARAQQWTQTGLLGTARSQHTASLLANGKVLVAGGISVLNPCCSMTATAELYDPATGQWSATGSLSAPRFNHIAVRLANGKVLVAGGNGDSFSTSLSTAEIYDPDTGAWSATGNLRVARGGHTATLLPDGRVLVAGGFSGGLAQNSAELYDPTTGTWSPTGMMNSARYYHTATLLANGKVLVAAGADDLYVLGTAELYDPATGSWTRTGDLITAREAPTATLVPNGKVLVTGGADGLRALDTAELYDPATGQWSTTGRMSTFRVGHTATLLPSGKVLVAAGYEGPISSAELYDPATGSWGVTGSLNTARATHTATLLANGTVLVAGGAGAGGSSHNSAELFTDTAGGANPIDTASFFVRQHYLDFLNREPDPLGDQWVRLIQNCPAGDTSCDRIHVSMAFFQSPEFQDRGYFAYRFYSVAFGRKPDFAEFMPDLMRVTGFLTNDQLEAAKVALINDFMARQAFVAKYNGLSNQSYVDTLLSTAGVDLSNRRSLIDALNNGGMTRAQVLRQIVDSGEVYHKYYNQAFVVMEYFGYLRRDPDILYLDWIDVLNGGSDPRHMVEGFVNSIEYRHRFGP